MSSFKTTAIEELLEADVTPVAVFWLSEMLSDLSKKVLIRLCTRLKNYKDFIFFLKNPATCVFHDFLKYLWTVIISGIYRLCCRKKFIFSKVIVSLIKPQIFKYHVSKITKIQ